MPSKQPSVSPSTGVEKNGGRNGGVSSLPSNNRVLGGHGTERAGTSPLNAEHRPGMFSCAACGQPLFESDTKFDSGTGWPSF